MISIPAWIEIAAGGAGLAFALGGLARLRRLPPRGRHDRLNAWGLLIFSLLLVLIGGVRWLAEYGRADL